MLLQLKEITSLLIEGFVERDKISSCIEQSELTTKTSAGWFSLSTGREGEDEDCVEETTLVSTLSDERVGLGGNDTNSTTLASLSKRRVESTRGKDGSIASSTNGMSRDNLR